VCISPQRAHAQAARVAGADLWRQVEIIRTTHGVPHVRADNMRAAGYALAWLQLEDYGPRTALNVLRAHGEMAKLFGHDSIESDFMFRRLRARAIETYPLMDEDTRDFCDGFAAGINRYITLHPSEFPAAMPASFTGYDVATLHIGRMDAADARSVLQHIDPTAGGANAPGRSGRGAGEGKPPDNAPDNAPDNTAPLTGGDSDEGSNAWAFAPSRTRSGKAILLRNPHLAWNAGYYEAHLTVPGKLDFYGDFRIGGPFGVIGGFNRDLGWSTTNNAQDIGEVYALDVDPALPDHYLFDGASLPLQHEMLTVEFRNGDGISTETREFWTTPIGPVILRKDGKIFVEKSANDGDYHAGDQFIRMMRARSLAEWKDAMKLRARPTSNFTYADRAGNIYYVWNASLPVLPHALGGDSTAFPAREMHDVWTRYVPWDSLPQFLNPKGGYIHNENDAPYYTNVRQPIDTTRMYPNFEPTSLDLRSQHAIQLIDTNKKLSLEDVIRLKHSYRMLLADRVKPDLIAAVKSANPTGDIAAAIAMLDSWDNTAAPESKGAVLFEIWWQRYTQLTPAALRFTRAWTSAEPLTTPRGIGNPANAVTAFTAAVQLTEQRFGRWDVAWGDVHRVRRGNVDVPVGGCSGALGCFRVLTYRADTDGKLVANGSDGWILAVEFGDVPRAFSILAYGESPNEASPWFSDQAEMFARGELKPVAFLLSDIEKQAVLRYRPGEK
jgi:acyl-homoserine-lactone acylase